LKEIPMIKASMWTQTNLREEAMILKLSELILGKSDEFKPTVIYGGKLTARKNKKFNKEDIEDINLLEKCLSDTDVLRIVLTNSGQKKEDFIFAYTIAFVPQFTLVSLEVSHTFFINQNKKDKFMQVIIKMIEVIHPIFVNVDDISNSLDIMEDAGEDTYQLNKYVPAIFWGNFFGGKYISYFGEEKLLQSPYGHVSKVSGGVLITMTQDPMEFNSFECIELRKKLSKYLGVGKSRLFRKLFM